MSIHLVTHCYVDKLPQYAEFLRLQLASLFKHRCEVPVVISVCYCPDDKITSTIVDRWSCRPLQIGPLRVVQPIPLPKEYLARRCMGRNKVALNCREDVCWFLDCDQYFGEGCLDALWEITRGRLHETEGDGKPAMLFPCDLKIHADHRDGDALVKQVNGLTDEELLSDSFQLDDSLFIPKHERKAIGGIQVVSGEFARRYGYLNGDPKWQRPNPDLEPFSLGTSDDIAYRKVCNEHGGIQPIQIPNLYRFRHTHNSDRKVAAKIEGPAPLTGEQS